MDVSQAYMKETFGGKDNTADDTASFDGTFFWYWQLAEGVFHIGIVLGGLSICFLGRGRKGIPNLGENVYFWSMVVEVLVIDWSYCILFMHQMALCTNDFSRCMDDRIGGSWYDGAAYGIGISALGWMNNLSVALDVMAIPIELISQSYVRLRSKMKVE